MGKKRMEHTGFESVYPKNEEYRINTGNVKKSPCLCGFFYVIFGMVSAIFGKILPYLA